MAPASWVYFAGLYDTKFEAYCAAMWMEGDQKVFGRCSPSELQLYKTESGKFGVRFR
ncbi:hypothetical protein [Sulfoacidibacillus thermotolerans]|uniref:hypothetical protein n=1 Tax=Sulfoacidibacillus thermotolerans TaxID=1765684 RepID=UPI0015E80FE2|nr:hypothetical protein [Sulfoacidibacillus thermotolerans]